MLDLWDWRRQIADLYCAVRASVDPEAGWRLWRDTRNRLYAHHSQTPLEAAALARFTGVPLYPYDAALRFEVGLTEASGPALTLEAGHDGDVRAHPFARTDGLAALGGELTLYWIGGYGGGVFLPFSDATSGQETYGGGRYLLDTIKGADLGQTADGRVILDFNFAFAPSCAHSDRFVCPLAPLENRLAEAVRGGERIGSMVA